MYVLDTDICRYLMKRSQQTLIERVTAFAPRDLKASVITLFELEYGILRSDRPDALRQNGVCVLRYDNEAGKGDHKHVGEEESPYVFTTPARLLADFWNDVDHWRP